MGFTAGTSLDELRSAYLVLGTVDHLHLNATTPNSQAASLAIKGRAHTTSSISQTSDIHSFDVGASSMLSFIASRHLHEVGRRPEGGPSL
jgi:hypothetical protein